MSARDVFFVQSPSAATASHAFPLRDNRYPTKAGQTTKSTMKTTTAQKDLCLLRLRFVPFVYLPRFVGRREKVYPEARQMQFDNCLFSF